MCQIYKIDIENSRWWSFVTLSLLRYSHDHGWAFKFIPCTNILPICIDHSSPKDNIQLSLNIFNDLWWNSTLISIKMAHPISLSISKRVSLLITKYPWLESSKKRLHMLGNVPVIQRVRIQYNQALKMTGNYFSIQSLQIKSLQLSWKHSYFLIHEVQSTNPVSELGWLDSAVEREF